MFIYKPPPRPPPYYFCLRLSVERSINALSLWCFPVRCPYWAAAVGISGLILFFLRWKALGLSVWTGGLGLWWSSNLLIRGARGGCCGSLERVCNMCQCQMEVCLLWACVFTGRVIARVKHQEKRSKIEKLSENVRFAFLLRNIFEREWKCFALVCRAQTKDTHTHTHCSVYTLLQRQFFSVFTLPRATRTHARAQTGSRADSVSHTAFGDSRPRCSLSEVEPPADNARAHRQPHLLGEEKVNVRSRTVQALRRGHAALRKRTPTLHVRGARRCT